MNTVVYLKINMRIVRQHINDKNTIIDYDDLSSLISDLYKKKLDAIIISSNYKVMFKTIETYSKIDEETKVLFLEGMKKSVEMASHAGVILAMEIMDTPFVGTILRAMHYIKEIRSPYFKIYPYLIYYFKMFFYHFFNGITGYFMQVLLCYFNS